MGYSDPYAVDMGIFGNNAAMTKPTMYTIDAPHFNAGIVYVGNKPIKSAPILAWVLRHGWSPKQLELYCRNKGWTMFSHDQKSPVQNSPTPKQG